MTAALVGSTLLRHQLASLAATAADFGTMVLLVEVAKVSPTVATLTGASVGAVVNFTLNRRHTFNRSRMDAASVEAARYALVSGASALLNAAGEHVGVSFLALPYVLVRVVVAVVVGLGWNYPLHRSFVFRAGRKEA